MTPLHQAAKEGKTDVIKVLVQAGASLFAADKYVIKPSVKLIQSNIKLFKGHMRNVI
jgi:ankyrin repeat protein